SRRVLLGWRPTEVRAPSANSASWVPSKVPTRRGPESVPTGGSGGPQGAPQPTHTVAPVAGAGWWQRGQSSGVIGGWRGRSGAYTRAARVGDFCMGGRSPAEPPLAPG